MPKVYNIHHNNAPDDSVYVGRGSIFGNPYVIGEDGNRDEVCDKFEDMVNGDQEAISLIKDQLKDKDLVCFCAPSRCHADFLLKIANQD